MSAQIRLGTSSFTADGWNGSFYPKGMKSSDYLGYYSRRFVTQYVYANNHYAGFAPATVELFRSLCKARGIETPLNVRLPVETEPTLFDISPD